MKADPEVKMISAEAPILFAKGCDIFITELTMRAWIHAEDNKRRTLQRSDIAAALAKSDMFDFLIDIVPREDAGTHGSKRPTTAGGPQQAPQQQLPQQQPPPQQMPDYNTMQHGGMPPPDAQYRTNQMYGAQMGPDSHGDPNQGYPPPGPPMFSDQGMYNPYAAQSQFGAGQPMYPSMQQRPPSSGYAGRPRTAGGDDPQEYGPG